MWGRTNKASHCHKKYINEFETIGTQNLKDGGVGHGIYAFSFNTHVFVPKSELKRITVQLEDSNVVLQRNTVAPD